MAEQTIRLRAPDGRTHDSATICAVVLVHAHAAGRGADDARDLVADLGGHLPPALLPAAHPPRRPRLGVLGEVARRLSRHRPERVADHVDRARQDRELAAPALEIVHGAYNTRQ